MDITNLISEIETDWKDVLLEIAAHHAEKINTAINKDIEVYKDVLEILPTKELIFNAFKHFDVSETKTIIIGMDCYPNKGDAMGLCFSVPSDRKITPSLRNIFKELKDEYSLERTNTDLTSWAQQGVLMLNSALTVREKCPGSHLKIWKSFTSDLVSYIGKNSKNIVYVLWGNDAKEFASLVNKESNCILTHSHPSPLARMAFVGNGHFKKANEYLVSVGKDQIDWMK